MTALRLILPALLALLAAPAMAATLTLTAYERGGDVIFAVDGTLDLTDFTSVGTSNFGTGLAPSEGRFALGTGGVADVYRSDLTSVPVFGTSPVAGPGVGTGGVFSITDIGTDGLFDVAVEAGFVSGSSVDETLVFAGQTFNDLGVFQSFSADVMLTSSQTYSVRIGNQFAPPAVPLPAGGLLLITGAGAFFVMRRRKAA